MVGRRLSDTQVLALGSLGCLLAVAAGAVAGTGRGVPIAGALLGLVLTAGAIALYLRDPVRALIWLWVIVVINAPLTTLVGQDTSLGVQLRHSDEYLVLLLVLLTVSHTLRTNTRIPLWYVVPVLGLLLSGLLSAVIHQVPLGITMTGAWLGLKLWTMVGVALLLPWKSSDLARVYRVLTTVGLIVAAFGFADFATGGGVSKALHLQAYQVPAGKTRAEAVHSIFGGPYGESLFMSILFAITFARFATKRNRDDLVLAVIFAVSVLLTLRLKGVLCLTAVLIIVALAQQTVRERNAVTALLVGALMVGGVYTIEANVIARQVSLYTSSQSTTRAQLYLSGNRIAEDNLPIGAGFGRFASYPSRLHYSPIYDEYGLGAVQGLSRVDSKFIDDTSWPSVMGETGYVGFGAYLLGLMFLVLTMVRRLRTTPMTSRWVPLAALCTLAVILTDSIGSPALFDWVPAVSFALILGPAMAAARPESPRSPPEKRDEELTAIRHRLDEPETRAENIERPAAQAEGQARQRAAKARRAWFRETEDRIGGASGRATAAEEQARSTALEIDEPEPEPVAEESEPVPEPDPPVPAPAGLLDLNAATFEQLRELRMSVTQSNRVLAYRERLGGFNSVDDLDQVPGFRRAFRVELKQRLRT